MSDRYDAFGDRVGSIDAGDELSFTQNVALKCREDLCELIYTRKTHESDLSFMLQTCGFGAISVLCNAVITVHLAGDGKELRYMTVLRSILRKTENLKKIGYLKEFIEATVELYEFYAGDEKRRDAHPLSPLALVLQNIAEKYYFCSEKHYFTVINKALNDLYACLNSPFLSKISSYKACEGAGRGTLLVARYYYYNAKKPQKEVDQLLISAREYLDSALKYVPGIDSSIRDKIVKNSTVMYDLARINSLLNNFDDAQKYLINASHEMAIPPMSVYFVEPDFNYLRGAPWFANLGSTDETSPQAVLKKSLILMGFSLTSMDGTLRFPLYMGKPQGPIPESVYEAGINGYERVMNKERVENRLEKIGLRTKDVPGDGNCQFYSISDQLFGEISYANDIRKKAAEWLQENPNKEINGCPLNCFIYDKTWDEYCEEVGKNGSWGDQMSLIAVANVYNLRIIVISSVKGDNYVTEVYPDPPLPNREPPRQITIAHIAELHYCSVVPL